MSGEFATVFGHSVERRRGTVHLLLRTDLGAAAFRLSPADAQQVGSDLRIKAVHLVGERNADPSAPITKPSGQLF